MGLVSLSVVTGELSCYGEVPRGGLPSAPREGPWSGLTVLAPWSGSSSLQTRDSRRSVVLCGDSLSRLTHAFLKSFTLSLCLGPPVGDIMANGVGGPHQLGRGQNLAQGWHSLYELAAPLSQALNSIPFGGLSFLNHKGGTLPTSEGETRMCDAFKRLAQGACPGNVTHHTVNVLVMVGGEAERRHGRKQCRQAGATCPGESASSHGNEPVPGLGRRRHHRLRERGWRGPGIDPAMTDAHSSKDSDNSGVQLMCPRGSHGKGHPQRHSVSISSTQTQRQQQKGELGAHRLPGLHPAITWRPQELPGPNCTPRIWSNVKLYLHHSKQTLHQVLLGLTRVGTC